MISEGCREECTCSCHSDVHPIPSWLNPWLGACKFPRALAASLLPYIFSCDDARCSKSFGKVHTVRYYLPTWFAHVEASIRFQAFPIYFCIQTPKVVRSLQSLYNINFQEFQRSLSSRELSILDVEQDGFSILHVRLKSFTIAYVH